MRCAMTVLVLVVGCVGCSSNETTTRCDADRGVSTASGECAGIAQASLCSDRFCVPEGAACTRVVYVEAGAPAGDGTQDHPMAELADAAAAAESGACIALAEGTYGAAALGEGVSLFGTGASGVSIEAQDATPALTVPGGQNTRIRGLRAAGIRFEDVRGALVEQVAVEAAGGVGVDLRNAQGTLTHVLVRGTTGAGHGVYLDAQSQLSLAFSLIEGNVGAGVAAAGVIDVNASVVRDNTSYGVSLWRSPAPSAIRQTLVSGNGVVGVFVSDAKLEVESCEIAATRDTVDGAARLLEAQAGADVTILGASLLRDSEYVGVLVDESRFRMEGGENSGNERGFWIQGTVADRGEGESPVALVDVDTHDNGFVGIGATEAVGIIIQGGLVSRTTEVPVGDGNGGVIRAGDGIQALAGSNLVADGVSLIDNERAGALFDGEGGTTGGVVRLGEAEGGQYGIIIQGGMPADGFDETASPEELTGDAMLDVTADRLAAGAPAGVQ